MKNVATLVREHNPNYAFENSQLTFSTTRIYLAAISLNILLGRRAGTDQMAITVSVICE